jgi:hypothetical protein
MLQRLRQNYEDNQQQILGEVRQLLLQKEQLLRNLFKETTQLQDLIKDVAPGNENNLSH